MQKSHLLRIICLAVLVSLTGCGKLREFNSQSLTQDLQREQTCYSKAKERGDYELAADHAWNAVLICEEMGKDNWSEQFRMLAMGFEKLSAERSVPIL